MKEAPALNLVRNQFASGLVGSELPFSKGGLVVAPADYPVARNLSLNGDSALLAGTGARLNGRPSGLVVIGREAGAERPLRRGRKMFLLSDFGDATAQGEYVNAAVSVTREKDVISDIISIPDIGGLNIAHGAWVTRQQLKRESGAVAVTVVDPGVGTDRKPIAIVTEDDNVLIVPNNGVGFPAAVEHGIKGVYELNHDKVEALTGKPISKTFHGRDLFAPAGALIASGVDITRFAAEIDQAELVEFELKKKSLLHVDNYGNLKVSDEIPQDATSVQLRTVSEAVPVEITIPILPKFADAEVGTMCAYIGNSGGLEIAVNKGSAAKFLSSAGFELQVGETLNYEYVIDKVQAEAVS